MKRHKAGKFIGRYRVCDVCGAKRAWDTYKPWRYPAPWVLNHKIEKWCPGERKVSP